MSVRIGEVLKGRYQIESILGEGGMGTVYLARDLLTDRRRAIKELYPDPLADEARLQAARLQFRREAEALSKLRQGNIPRVSDYFGIDENDYLVMDFIEGESLADILSRKKRPTERLVYAWLEQILDALDYCHRHQVLHRDIKPANIILTPEGQVMLVDFSLVKVYDPRNPRTATIVRGLGTPEYTPLEQYDTGAGHTDTRSDIYALGATLYHLLTGQAPQPVSQRILNPDTQPALQELNPKISPWVTQFVQRAMAIHPQDRFESVREMRRELDKRLFKLKRESRAARARHRAPHDYKRGSAEPPAAPTRRAPGVRHYVEEYTPRLAPVVLSILAPVTVIVVLAVFVTVLLATSSTTVSALVIGPLILGGMIYHKIRQHRQGGPPRY
jgi:serine/threonine protein kinase